MGTILITIGIILLTIIIGIAIGLRLMLGSWKTVFLGIMVLLFWEN